MYPVGHIGLLAGYQVEDAGKFVEASGSRRAWLVAVSPVPRGVARDPDQGRCLLVIEAEHVSDAIECAQRR